MTEQKIDQLMKVAIESALFELDSASRVASAISVIKYAKEPSGIASLANAAYQLAKHDEYGKYLKKWSLESWKTNLSKGLNEFDNIFATAPDLSALERALERRLREFTNLLEFWYLLFVPFYLANLPANPLDLLEIVKARANSKSVKGYRAKRITLGQSNYSDAQRISSQSKLENFSGSGDALSESFKVTKMMMLGEFVKDLDKRIDHCIRLGIEADEFLEHDYSLPYLHCCELAQMPSDTNAIRRIIEDGMTVTEKRKYLAELSSEDSKATRADNIPNL